LLADIDELETAPKDSQLVFVYTKGDRAGQYRQASLQKYSNGRLKVMEENGHCKIYYSKYVVELHLPPVLVSAMYSEPASNTEVAKYDRQRKMWVGAADRSSPSRVEDSGLSLEQDSADSVPVGSAGMPWEGSLALVPREPAQYPNVPFISGAVQPDRLLYNPMIKDALSSAMRHFKKLMRVAWYACDMAIVEPLTARLRKGDYALFGVLDEGQVNNPSCTTQRAAMLALREWNTASNPVQFRMRRPASGMTSAQHEKSWLFDEELLVIGSANATENSFTKCEEACIFTMNPDLIAIQADHFQKIWLDATEVDWKQVKRLEDENLEQRAEKARAKAAAKAKAQEERSRSQSSEMTYVETGTAFNPRVQGVTEQQHRNCCTA